MIEVVAPLRVADFDALAATVDAWLSGHDALQGVVVHAGAIPGWENLGHCCGTSRFVRDHHRKVRRVALAVDGRLADRHPPSPITSCRPATPLRTRRARCGDRLGRGSGRRRRADPGATHRQRDGVIRRARVGDWLVEPGPPCTRMWRWGRVMGVLPDGNHLVVRWYGDSHDTMVLASVDARIESPDHEPQWAGDAVGLLPAV